MKKKKKECSERVNNLLIEELKESTKEAIKYLKQIRKKIEVEKKVA